MRFSDAELQAFENDVLKGAWNYQRAKGKVDGAYPTTLSPIAVHRRLFGGPPKTKDRQDILNALDKKHRGLSQASGDYIVTVLYGPSRYVYTFDGVRDEGHARSMAVAKYIRENLYGHKTQTLVNTLIRRGEIVLEIEQTR